MRSLQSARPLQRAVLPHAGVVQQPLGRQSTIIAACTPNIQRGVGAKLRKLCRSQRVAAAASGSSASPEPFAADHRAEVERLQSLVAELRAWPSADEKVRVLRKDDRVQAFCKGFANAAAAITALPAEEALILLCLPAMGQQHVLATLPDGAEEVVEGLHRLASALKKADVFYSSLGGIVGYQAKCLELIDDNASSSGDQAEAANVQLFMPQGPNLDGIGGRQIAAHEAAKGLEALPHMAEIWPLGGAGDRLGLECEKTGKSIPTAMLPYCGRTLLEGLIRDLQARESLYYKLYGEQCTTPVVIMTSEAKENHRHVMESLAAFDWFGRGEESFRVICQPLVPVVSAVTGEWLLPEALSPMMKPGGHGAIWKLMLDHGAFTWLDGLDRQAALVRQISNPLAGTDATMLALTGAGYADGRSFGFASCDRTAGATEGMNALIQRRLPLPGGGSEYAYNVTNIEYTEFERLGLCGGDAVLPANTNILYVSLKAAEAAVKAGVASGGGAALPGMIFNGKKKVAWVDAGTGQQREEAAGRMECTMQNLVDSMAQRFREPIPTARHGELTTFVVYNKRRRVTSSAKKRRAAGASLISQTPDGSFLDLMRNSEEVLHRCGVATPEVGTVEEYLARGPGFVFLFHPALGPLWDVVAQKIRGGALAAGSELVLEVAEAAIADLRLDGSLLVEADCIYGRTPGSRKDAATDGGSALPIAEQTVTYQETGSEAIQYSRVMPDLAEASGMVVPLQRLRASATSGSFSAAGRGAMWDLAEAARGGGGQDSEACHGPNCARVRLNGVVVNNLGIDWASQDNVFWQHKVRRREAVRILLHGQSEFEASNVCLTGSHTFEVPDGYRMVVSSAPGGGIRRVLSPLAGRRPTWQWRYLSGRQGAIQLQMEQPISPLPGVPLTSRPLESEMPFTYMI